MIQQEKSLMQRIAPHLIAIIAFIAIVILYFSPIIQGKQLKQDDVTSYIAMSQELREYRDKEGGSSAWTGSMFSGMPSYQITVWGGSPNFLDYIEKPVKMLDDKSAGAVLMTMFMTYAFFLIIGMRPSAAALGAIAYSLSSYNIIILAAGHVTKAWALAYMPIVIGGLIATFQKRKLLLGGIIMALGLALQIKSNHLQITYYTAMFCFILYVGLVAKTIFNKEIKTALKASGILAIAVVVAVLCNLGGLYANWEMARESTRGKSELTSISDDEKKSSGLDREYAFGWSYGKAETLSLLIPDIYGGASGGKLSRTSNLAQEMTKQGYASEVKSDGIQSYTYWGDQPFTSGPVYFGAIICFLFLLGMIVIRSRMKWVILAATVFFIFLSWGKNFGWFNDFFFYHFPLYNKFRAVSMTLVIPSFTVVMMAVWGICEFMNPERNKAKMMKALYISAGIFSVICLTLWLIPDAFFDFKTAKDMEWASQMPEWYYQALVRDRMDLLSSDAIRSFGFIIFAAALLWVWLRVFQQKEQANKTAGYFILAIAGLVLIDLWGVDKRYLNDSNFEKKSTYLAGHFAKSNADNIILQDQHPSYRVLNINNTFQDAITPYYHKSIGGYHAAKLKRYQELIDHRLGTEVAAVGYHANGQLQTQIALMNGGANLSMGQVSQTLQDSVMPLLSQTSALNMLNARYIIVHPDLPPLINPYAYGNAWFVSDYKIVDNADAEIVEIEKVNLAKTAVIDKRFEKDVNGLKIQTDSLNNIELTNYKPNIVEYKSNAKSEQLAVFSEIYFSDGWQAYIDGKEASHFRADWTLRAMLVPAGEHAVTFMFEPHGYNTSRTVSSVASGLLLLLIIGMIVTPFVNKKKEEK